MKSDKKIMTAFLLNCFFSLCELIGGALTGSVAILSDALHDTGDALGIGISFMLERKSVRKADATHTYGYRRYSVLGAAVTDVILIAGSLTVIYKGIDRMINPEEINSTGMMIFAVFGLVTNLLAVFLTKGGGSMNLKAVNLHMLEDVLGWAVVLVGAVVMRLTDLAVIDPIMSIGVSLFILINVIKNLKEIFSVFLEKVPDGIVVSEIQEHIQEIDGVLDVHHMHIWTMDGQNHYATMHIVSNCDGQKIKEEIRRELRDHGINHITLELEKEDECCCEKACKVDAAPVSGHHHHHHH